jgi:uncharacterized protein YcnI
MEYSSHRTHARLGFGALDLDEGREGSVRPVRDDPRVESKGIGIAVLAVSAVALAASASAAAIPSVSPPIVEAKKSQLYTLVVPPEKDDVVMTLVEFYPPYDFEIESFAEAEGWEQDWTIQSGTPNVVQKATWERAELPKDDEEIEEAVEHAPVFQFVGRPRASKTYSFEVRQTYADGSVIHWTGPRSQAFPADPRNTSRRSELPTLVAESTLGGDRGISKLAIIALIVGGLALVVASAVLLLGGGKSMLRR